MADVINVGTSAESGDGDGIREGGVKANAKWAADDILIAANTAKVTNTITNLSEGTSTTTTVDVNSSDGTNATLVAASTLRAGLLTKAKFDQIGTNTTNIQTNADDIAAISGLPHIIVNIGDWNTNSSGAGSFLIIIAHTIVDFTKIRRITAMIRNDLNTSYYPLDSVAGSGSTPNGGVASWGSTNATLIAATGGIFDSGSFVAGGYNRGYIIIEYIP